LETRVIQGSSAPGTVVDQPCPAGSGAPALELMVVVEVTQAGGAWDGMDIAYHVDGRAHVLQTEVRHGRLRFVAVQTRRVLTHPR
jgi:hypothetical protein